MGCVHSLSSKESSKDFENIVTGSPTTENGNGSSSPAKSSAGLDRKISLVMKQKRDAAMRRGDIFSETIDFQEEYEKLDVPKSEEARKIITAAVQHNFLFSTMSVSDVDEMVCAMTCKNVERGEIVIQEGDSGDYFYVVETGSFDIRVKEAVVGSVGSGTSFGELALLHNSARAATIAATENGRLWALDRVTFRRIVARSVSDQISTCKEVLKNVPLLNTLTEDQFDRLAAAIQEVQFDKDERIITKGEPGNVCYILKTGNVVCTDAGEAKNVMEDLQLGAGDYFGERALMTNEPRAANVTAVTDVVALALDRQAFNEILGPLREVIDRNMGVRVLKSIPMLQALSETERQQLYAAFEIKKYTRGESIIQEGETGTEFYIVKKGSVTVKKKNENQIVNNVAVLSSGEYFGEMALLHEEPRAADVVADCDVECFTLCQTKFEELLGPLQDILNREADERKALMDCETSIDFNDLDILKTLGTGTFGRVKIVRHKHTNNVYALKIMQKAQVVAYKQKANVLHEKNILAMCHHPFILKLHQTFKDAKHLYLLLELVQGGELFTYLHCSKRETEYISDDHTRFYASNVLLALEYLHERSILYRDLKPENLLIDATGYLKVADFGFAKIVQNRTYTLCGTPEYLAPELVLGKGHNKGVDYWALGVLIYEMVVGHSPFAGACSSDQMQICRNIVGGRLDFPKWVSESCRDVIEKLLTKDLSKRLGTTHGGSRAIRTHPWFAHTNWEVLLRKKEEAPWVPRINGQLDTSNFDPYEDEVVDMAYRDDGTNWDADF